MEWKSKVENFGDFMMWTPYHIIKKNNENNKNLNKILLRLERQGYIIKKWKPEVNEYVYARTFGSTLKFKDIII